MATNLHGSKQQRFTSAADVFPREYNIIPPYLLSNGIYKVPNSNQAFTAHIDQTTVVGTPITLVSAIANYMPAVAGLRVAFNSAADYIIVELTAGFDWFKVDNGFIGSLDLVFTPAMVYPASNSQGIQLLQPAGVAARVVATCWGWYIPI